MTAPEIEPDHILRAKLLGSFTLFLRTFYKLRTNNDFVLGEGVGRESYHITIARELTKIARCENELQHLLINIPPRYGKTTLIIYFIAWTLARNPSSSYIYVSYSHTLAAKQTRAIREIVTMPMYRRLFGVELSKDTNAKDYFITTAGGEVYAAGADGTITGSGAGQRNSTDFAGCIVIDDIHKPSEVNSDVMREKTNAWFYETLSSRVNNPAKTPIIAIGQCLHEDDLLAKLKVNDSFHKIIIPALDVHDNPLDVRMHTREMLLEMKRISPYVFAAQYMQDPQPAGGGLFRVEDFIALEFEPKIIQTFLTIDTAETDKTYNDKTVFSFWGVYKIEEFGKELDITALHWIDCAVLSIEPKDLESELRQFMSDCMRHRVPPDVVAIEKKSTGTTLLSVLDNLRGISVQPINRTKASGSKTDRFLEMQPYIKRKLLTLPLYGKHTKDCIEHMRKITANNSHRFDDICDTAYDAIRIALIDKSISAYTSRDNQERDSLLDSLIYKQRKVVQLTKGRNYEK